MFLSQIQTAAFLCLDCLIVNITSSKTGEIILLAEL